MSPRLLILLPLAIVATLSIGCTAVPRHVDHPHPAKAKTKAKAPKHGPPPHAPAHGYRHKHHSHAGEVEFVFDSGRGVYVVVGWPGLFFVDPHYFRQIEGRWHLSARIDSGWTLASPKRLPPGLAKRAARGKHKKHRKGPHPAKHAR